MAPAVDALVARRGDGGHGGAAVGEGEHGADDFAGHLVQFFQGLSASRKAECGTDGRSTSYTAQSTLICWPTLLRLPTTT